MSKRDKPIVMDLASEFEQAANATDEEPPLQTTSEIFAKSISNDFASQQMFMCLVDRNSNGTELWWPAVRYENIIEASTLCNDTQFHAVIGEEVFDALEMGGNAALPAVYKLLGFTDGHHLTDEAGAGKKVETLPFSMINIGRFYSSTPEGNVYFKENEHLFSLFRRSMRQARELLKLSTGIGRKEPVTYFHDPPFQPRTAASLVSAIKKLFKITDSRLNRLSRERKLQLAHGKEEDEPTYAWISKSSGGWYVLQKGDEYRAFVDMDMRKKCC